MRSLLEEIVRGQAGWVELRHHRRRQNDFTVQKGRVDVANAQTIGGVGVRVLEKGSFGFASTVEIDRASIQAAVERARGNAREVAKLQNKKVGVLPVVDFAKGDYVLDGYEELEAKPLDEKLQTVIDLEKKTLGEAGAIHTAMASYREIFEEKTVVTSDGASASQKLVRPELRVVAYAEKAGDHNVGHNSLGVTGGWTCLFDHPSADAIVEKTARQAVDLLGAPHIAGGQATVILEPSLVGLLAHEAIGHTVEADFVLSGSVAAGKIGKRVGSELVTL